MNTIFLESNKVLTEIISIYRFKKELVNNKIQYGYIIFCQDNGKMYTEDEEGSEINGLCEFGRIYESCLITDSNFKNLLFTHNVNMSSSYEEAFWKAHKYIQENGPDKMCKEEYFYVFNKYQYLTI